MRVYTLTKDEKERIIESLREALQGREDVLFAYLHGSFLEDGPFSDIDVAIYVDSKVHSFYEEELSRLIGFPVDVRVINDAPTTFKFRVMGDLFLFSQDEKSGATSGRERCVNITITPTTLTFTGGRPLEYDKEQLTRLMSEAINALEILYELLRIPREDMNSILNSLRGESQ